MNDELHHLDRLRRGKRAAARFSHPMVRADHGGRRSGAMEQAGASRGDAVYRVALSVTRVGGARISRSSARSGARLRQTA